MVGRQNGGLKCLQELELRECSLLGLASVFEVFTLLRVLYLDGCIWPYQITWRTSNHLRYCTYVVSRIFSLFRYCPSHSRNCPSLFAQISSLFQYCPRHSRYCPSIAWISILCQYSPSPSRNCPLIIARISSLFRYFPSHSRNCPFIIARISSLF